MIICKYRNISLTDGLWAKNIAIQIISCFRYFNEELRNSTKFNFKLLGTKMVDMKAGIDEKHINRDRNMLMRKNSVRGAIRKSSRQNSMNKESTGT